MTDMSTESPARGEYIHGYAETEQQRLIAQAEFWKDTVILDGTYLPRGTRLLDVGCGVGAVLQILGNEFPGIHPSGIDIASTQIDFAEKYLSDHGVAADLQVADARDLPFDNSSFDQLWMMWTL